MQRILAIFLLTVVLASAQAPRPPEPARLSGTLWVDPRGNDSSAARGNMQLPFASLAGALAAAQNNDVVIMRGAYTPASGAVTIVQNFLTLDATGAILNSASQADVQKILVTGTGVTINGLTVDGKWTNGVRTQNTGLITVQGSYCTLHDVYVHHGSAHGIYAKQGFDGLRVTSCRAEYNNIGICGANFSSGGIGAEVSGCVVQNNGLKGIFFSGQSTGPLKGIRIVDNTVRNNPNASTHDTSGIEIFTVGTNVMVANNYIAGNGFGISIGGSTKATVSNNHVRIGADCGIELIGTTVFASDNTIDGLDEDGTQIAGVGYTLGNPVTDCHITGGSVINCGQSVHSFNCSGITVRDLYVRPRTDFGVNGMSFEFTSDVTVENCKLDLGNASSNGISVAQNIADTRSGYYFRDNIFNVTTGGTTLNSIYAFDQGTYSNINIDGTRTNATHCTAAFAWILGGATATPLYADNRPTSGTVTSGFPLSSTIGTDVQPYSSVLTTWSGINPAAGIGTFLATPSSANLKAAVTDETGSGALVFATSPTIKGALLYDNAGTPKLAADLSTRKLYASDGTTLQLVWDNPSDAVGMSSLYSLGDQFLINGGYDNNGITIDGNTGEFDSYYLFRSQQGFYSADGNTSFNNNGFRGNGSLLTNVNVATGVYYVSATGNDSNDGLTWNTAFATLSGALATIGGTTNNTNPAVINIGVGTFAAPGSQIVIKGVKGFKIEGRGPTLTTLTCRNGGSLIKFVNCDRATAEKISFADSADHTGWPIECTANFSGGSFVGGVTPTRMVIRDCRFGTNLASPNRMPYAVKFTYTAGSDDNNDQSMIQHCLCQGVDTCFAFEGQNSLDHQIVDCTFTNFGTAALSFAGGSATAINPNFQASASTGTFVALRDAVGDSTPVYRHKITIIGAQSEAGQAQWATATAGVSTTTGGVNTPVDLLEFVGGELNSGGVGGIGGKVVDWAAASSLTFNGTLLGPAYSGAIIYASSASSVIRIANCESRVRSYQWAGVLSVHNVTTNQTAGDVLAPIGSGKYVATGYNTNALYSGHVFDSALKLAVNSDTRALLGPDGTTTSLAWGNTHAVFFDAHNFGSDGSYDSGGGVQWDDAGNVTCGDLEAASLISDTNLMLLPMSGAPGAPDANGARLYKLSAAGTIKWKDDSSSVHTFINDTDTGTVTDTMLANAVKPAVAVVATNNLTLSGEQIIDGQLTSGSLVLPTNQSTGSQNGPWISGSGAWTRPGWYTNGSTTQAPQFLTTFVRLGTTYQGSTWRMTTANVTIGTTATTWVQTPTNINSVTGTLSGSSISGGTFGAVNGSALTSLNATNLSSGTVAAARLPNPTSSTLGGVQSIASASHKWINTISTSGVPSLTQPASSDLSDGGGAANAANGFMLLDANGKSSASVPRQGSFATTNSGSFWTANTLTTSVQTGLGSWTPATSGVLNVVDRNFHFFAAGTNVFNNTSSCQISVRLGGTIIATFTSGSATTNATARPWTVTGNFTVITTGSTGTIICHGFATIMVSGNSNASVTSSASTGLTTTVDLTGTPVLDVTVTYGSNSGTANVFTQQMFSGQVTN